MEKKFLPIVFIGAGVFGEIMLNGLLRSNLIKNENILATTKTEVKAKKIKKVYNIKSFTSNNEAIKLSKTIFLCVRPQDIERLSNDLDENLTKDKLIISVIAGVSLKTLTKLFKATNIIRANPNPLVETDSGFTAIAESFDLDEETRNWVDKLFSILGHTSFIPEEQLNSVSVLSGIAHVLYFYDCLVYSGMYLGLSKDLSEKIVKNSIIGAMNILNEKEISAADIIKEVTTPGGIGVEKIFSLDKLNVRGSIIESMKVAKNKASCLDKS